MIYLLVITLNPDLLALTTARTLARKTIHPFKKVTAPSQLLPLMLKEQRMGMRTRTVNQKRWNLR